MSRPTRVLLVEDSEQDAALVFRELRKAGLAPQLTRVATASALSEALGRAEWDIVLADFELPGFDGFAALRMVRDADPELPCVVVSGRVGEEIAVEAVRAGAQDFVPKDNLARLGPAVHRELHEARFVRARTRNERRIALQQAVTAALASHRSVSSAMPPVLRAIAERLDWEMAVLWGWDPHERLLRCTALWSTRERGAVEDELRGLALPGGSGVPGLVVERGGARWVADIAQEPQRPRPSASREGLRAAMAVPIRVELELACVLEVLSGRALEEDREVVATLESVAEQLGQALGRERALSALEESEARKAAVLEASLDAVITMDHRGRVLEFNPAAERIFGYAREEVMGKDMAALIIPPSLRDAHRRGLARYVATGAARFLGQRLELPAMRKDGAEFPAEIAFVRVDRSGPPVFTGFVRDVTHNVELFRALQMAEARHRILAEVGAALVESLDLATVLPRVTELLTAELCDWCAIHLFDEHGELQQVAASHRRASRTECIERLWRLHPPSAECEVGPARVARAGSPQLLARVTQDDIRRIARGSEEAALLTELGVGSYLAVPLSARGSVLGALSVVLEPGLRTLGEDELALCTDLAHRCATAIDNARLHREVQASLRARDDFLALAAHELQTPITPLRIRAQQLARLVEEHAGGTLSVDRVAEYVRGIERSSRRLSELVERLLDVSRLTVGLVTLEVSTFDLVELAREVAGELEEELGRAGCRVVWHLPDEPIIGSWDRRRIGLAIRNLLSNAVKFGPGRPIEVVVDAQAALARVSVRDHGPGLSAAEQGRLFERFARPAPLRHYGGFGLGLWMVRQVAEEHGGRVEMWSEPGEGARFGFSLPLVTPAARRPAMESAS